MEAGKLPFRDMRNADGRLFAPNAADIPAVLPAEAPLKFPVELGSLTYPLAFTKVPAILLLTDAQHAYFSSPGALLHIEAIQGY